MEREGEGERKREEESESIGSKGASTLLRQKWTDRETERHGERQSWR